MSDAPNDIISDEEITRVHGYANFGHMTPRDVVNDGVRKYAVGFTGGATQVSILREHGLITRTKGCGYTADLTKKGKRYARAIWNTRADIPPTLEAALALPEIAALVEDAYYHGFTISGEGWNGEYPFRDNNLDPRTDEEWVKNRDEELAALKAAGHE